MKLRGWAENVKKITYFGEDINLISNSYLSNGEHWGVFLKSQGPVYICGYNLMMEYTGLKDKNNVEIYEGDILKNGDEIGVVKWLENHASFCAKGISGMDYSLWNAQFTEVVGNIYENPELL